MQLAPLPQVLPPPALRSPYLLVFLLKFALGCLRLSPAQTQVSALSVPFPPKIPIRLPHPPPPGALPVSPPTRQDPLQPRKIPRAPTPRLTLEHLAKCQNIAGWTNPALRHPVRPDHIRPYRPSGRIFHATHEISGLGLRQSGRSYVPRLGACLWLA